MKCNTRTVKCKNIDKENKISSFMNLTSLYIFSFTDRVELQSKKSQKSKKLIQKLRLFKMD